MKGNYLASGSQDTNAKLWDLRSRRSIYTLKPHPKPVTCVDISIDGRAIASSSLNIINIWDSGKLLYKFKDGDSVVT